MLLRKFIVFSICLIWSLMVFAQQEQIQFSRIDISNGLSHNQVNSILKDTKGFLWFGTLAGLNRFDGYQFKSFKHDPRDTTTISDDFIIALFELPDHRLYIETRTGPNIYDPEKQVFIRNVKDYLRKLGVNALAIHDILKDNNGDFWFNAGAEGLFKYEVSKALTQHFQFDKEPLSLAKSPVSAIQTDAKGNIWVIHQDKIIEMIDKKTGKVQRRLLNFQLKKPSDFQDFKLFIDNEGDFWVYTLNNQRGIDYYSPGNDTKRFIDKKPGALNNNLINGILQDANGQIWIGTDHGGVNLLNKKDFSIRYLTNKEDDPKSIGQNSILCLYKDISGIIWVGTYKKGISFYHKKILKFPLHRHQYTNPNGLTYDDVNRFVEDDLGNIWIGTNGGGLFYFNRKTGQFKQFKHQPGNLNSLSNDIIVGLFIDKAKKLWIGTYLGGLDSFDGRQFVHYRHNAKVPESLSDDRVWDIMEDRKQNLWLATLGGGLEKLDRTTNTFIHKRANEPNGLISDFTFRVIEDRKGNKWVGTADGLDQITTDGKTIHYRSGPGGLINNIIYDLMQDSHGFIWIATGDGLSRLNPETKTFRNFDSKDGLTGMTTLKIVEDNDKNLWVSTSNGLFFVAVTLNNEKKFSYVFRKYDEHDGLQGSAFNANAGYKTRSGELVFGGANGFNLFDPKNILNDNTPSEIVFTDMQIANRSIGIGEVYNGRTLLKKAIIFTDTLQLRYNQNAFTLEFAALNFFDSKKIKYRYRLIGFDSQWQELASNNRLATYTNIDPGEYIFQVISTDASGRWSDNAVSLAISILPPFWRTWLAYVIYVLLIAAVLFLIRRRGIQKIKKEFLFEQERQQAKRMHELDMLKIKFFTNMSHEFRTPLSLIITPMDKLIKQAREHEKQPLMMIQRNGRRLLNLVNQLLDFRRMEVQELLLHRKPGDIIKFISELSFSFTDEAEKKNIRFAFHTTRNSLITLFDHDKMERIMFNLLSNAFKFTPEGGEVEVKLEDGPDFREKPVLILMVCDTGIGIPEANQEKVFERFFQNDMPDSIVNQGSGIGLSITKEFVKLHQGSISVRLKEGGGSIFTVVLPLPEILSPEIYDEEKNGGDLLWSKSNPSQEHIDDEAEGLIRNDKKPVILLVEDNDDFRFYLKDNLKAYYEIVEATNGRLGWQKVLAMQPALVVSDVSMPGLTGTELCKKIKADKRTAAIPVILLTALVAEEKQLEGLETGANDYMTKPFNFEILLSKIRNIVAQQKISKQTYQKQLEIKPSEIIIESLDEKFIRTVSFHMDKHLSDPDYSVDQLSSDMNISRVGLYKKLISLTGKSPVVFMRSYRLKRAIPLLERSQLTISQVAYEVGYNNPKQFSKYFKQEYGVLPSAYLTHINDKK